jgi:hypothetical protein
MQPTRAQAMIDRGGAESQRGELRAVDHAALTVGDRGDQ